MSQAPIEKPNVPTEILTSHAMLVPWGLYGQRIGLVEKLEEVPIPQRRRQHTPQTKLIEFFVSILAGCAHLQDISRRPSTVVERFDVRQSDGRIVRYPGSHREDVFGFHTSCRCFGGDSVCA